jgi:hypothetical protein
MYSKFTSYLSLFITAKLQVKLLRPVNRFLQNQHKKRV